MSTRKARQVHVGGYLYAEDVRRIDRLLEAERERTGYAISRSAWFERLILRELEAAGASRARDGSP